MTAPRIEIDLNKIRHNTRCLVARLKSRGIKVTAVTKAFCGHLKIAQAMHDGGAVGLAEARISNVEKLRKAGITNSDSLIHTQSHTKPARSCDPATPATTPRWR